MLMLGALLSEDFVVFIECDSSELCLSAGDVLHRCVFSQFLFCGGRSVRFDLLCGKIPPCCGEERTETAKQRQREMSLCCVEGKW